MSDSPEWPLGTGRELRPGQRAEVWIAGVDGRPAELVYTSDTVLLEAPNGRLHRLPYRLITRGRLEVEF